MLDHYSGATRIFPVIGDPVAQTKSPRGLTAAFEAAGIDALIVPMQVAPEDIDGFLQVLGMLKNVDGFLATVPHKFAALRFATHASDRANLLGSANVVRRQPDGTWYADMVDGLALIRAMEQAGCILPARRALMVGAGGAGGAVALELLNSGVAQLAIHDVDAARRDALLARLDSVHPGRAAIGSSDPAGFDVIVNCTPSGMRAGDVPPVLLDRLDQRMFVADVITAPEITPMLAAARALGCDMTTGLDMHAASIDLMRNVFFPHLATEAGPAAPAHAEGWKNYS